MSSPLDRLTLKDRLTDPLSNLNVQFTMMKLGDFRFALGKGAYNTLTKTQEWQWKASYPVSSQPRLNFAGYGEKTISLSGSIFPNVLGSVSDIEEMTKDAGKYKKPLLMVSGLGRVLGYWRIVSCVENQELFNIDAIPIKIDFTLSLTYDFHAKKSFDANVQIPTSINDLENILL